MGKSKVFAVLATAVAVAGVAGCGNSTTQSKATPAQTVNNGFSADFDQPGVQLVVSVKSSPSVLTGGGSTLTAAQAGDLLNSRLVISVHSNGSSPLSQATTTGGSSSDIALAEGGANLAEIRSVGNALYVRVDITKITSTYGLDKGSVAQFRQSLDQIAAEVPAAGALSAGKWVSIDVAGLLKLIGSQTGISIPSTTASPAEAKSFVDNLLGAFQRSYQVTKGSNGTYVLTVHDKTLVTNLSQAVSTFPGLANIPGYTSISHSADQIPASATVSVDASVSNGKVTQLALPLNQFPGNKLSGPATLVVAISGAGAVSAPSGATAVDLTQLTKLIGQISSSSTG
ncbi:MAG TPA: hypothetical protein VG184_12990 [Acidimicrobiales bacterium]|jgi:hypothetical protein|nr:hypothetical protein [Acidimicrobiales bacterium]